MFEFERVTSMNTLHAAWKKISSKTGCAGVDNIDLSFYQTDLDNNLRSLQTSISTGYYQPYAAKTYNHKNREISIHCVEDKIIQTAVADIIISAYTPSRGVHGFIKNRSIFSAKKSLDRALISGISEYCKVDIRRFYDSIDRDILLQKLHALINDHLFLALTILLINAHSPGISTGSCLSPALSNFYLDDFDSEIEKNTEFYSRYVDDMLIAPADGIAFVADKLSDIKLEVNPDKCKTVNAGDGFQFLGFDVKATIETAIQNENFELAEELYEVEQCDVSGDPEPQPSVPEEPESSGPTYEIPHHIRNVVKRCHIVKSIVEKAKTEKYLAYPEKTHLLQIFHCLADDGAQFIHHILSFCEDYDYGETQRRISKYPVPNPVGCKKLCERFGGKEKCICNFSNEKLYPTPIIHAKRVKADCFMPSDYKDSVGHFKGKTPEHRAEDALAGLLELNKKAYEIREQQGVFKGQIENLFERNNTREIQTPQGLLIKTDDGLFIKVG